MHQVRTQLVKTEKGFESMEECLVMEGIDVVKAMVVGMVKVSIRILK